MTNHLNSVNAKKILSIAGLAASATAAGFGLAGCRHSAASPPPAPPHAVPAQLVSRQTIAPAQPYTIVQQLPPAPGHVAHAHRELKVVHTSSGYRLCDSSGRYYDIGRDRSGHIYPAYCDPATHQYYPMYYDASRDRYYYVGREPDHRFYRRYCDDPNNTLYADDVDYDDYTPPQDDCPVISAPQPSVRHHDNNDWLWAIPVVIGAYFLLNQHHHHDNVVYAQEPPRGIYDRRHGWPVPQPRVPDPIVVNNPTGAYRVTNINDIRIDQQRTGAFNRRGHGNAPAALAALRASQQREAQARQAASARRIAQAQQAAKAGRIAQARHLRVMNARRTAQMQMAAKMRHAAQLRQAADARRMAQQQKTKIAQRNAMAQRRKAQIASATQARLKAQAAREAQARRNAQAKRTAQARAAQARAAQTRAVKTGTAQVRARQAMQRRVQAEARKSKQTSHRPSPAPGGPRMYMHRHQHPAPAQAQRQHPAPAHPNQQHPDSHERG